MFEEKSGLVHKIYLHIGNMRIYCAFKAFKEKDTRCKFQSVSLGLRKVTFWLPGNCFIHW